MTTVDFLHHDNPPIWAGVEPSTLGAEGQRQTYHATQPATFKIHTTKNKSRLYATMRIVTGGFEGLLRVEFSKLKYVSISAGTIPELPIPSPNYHTTPTGGRLSSDRFNEQRSPTRRVFSRTRLGLVIHQPRVRYLDR
ncbi:hypothetical protein TNCV_4520731 [Trichonephila clavipes]|nr:hypothetical protein TNCV_4520731 [Trichonephila clavipes]